MPLSDRLRDAAHRLRERRRRTWSGDGRSWIELRGSPDARELVGIIARVEAHPAVTWARWNAAFSRLVVAHQGELEPILERVREAEAEMGTADRPFPADPPKHPGDAQSLRRSVTRAVANLASIGTGAALGLAGRPRAVSVDLAALSAALENLPPARRWVDRTLGGSRSDLVLSLANSATQAMARGATGQVADLAYRGLRLLEIRAQRDAWRRREGELAGTPEDHPAEAPIAEPRPAPLPRGPIEQYAEPASMMTLGGFGAGVAATGQAERAAASLLGAVPKPARVGREAFAATLGRELGLRGVVIVDNRPLRRLDRVDALILPRELLEARWGEIVDLLPAASHSRAEVQLRAHRLFLPDAPGVPRIEGEWSLQPVEGAQESLGAWAAEQRGRLVLELRRAQAPVGWVAVRRVVEPELRALVVRARSLRLRLCVAADDPSGVSWAEPDQVLPEGAGLTEAVRGLQELGHGVLLVTVGPSPALPAADVSLALRRPGLPAPWGAHLIGVGEVGEVALLLEAVHAARRASQQSAWIAGAEAVAGFALNTQEERPGRVRSIMATAGLANLVATANGLRVARGIAIGSGGGVDRTPWHALEPEEALRRARSRATGLSSAEVSERRRNPAPEPGAGRLFLEAVWREVASPFAPVLATAAGLSALVGSPVDAGLVAGTVLASGVFSGWQQVSASRALRALERARPVPVRVRRDGARVELPADQLVPGDVIELEAGDRVPADARILEAVRLETDESSLTGESTLIPKTADPTFSTVIAERASMLYADTTVAAGRAVALVVAVGLASESRRGALAAGREAGGVHARLEQLMAMTGPVAALSGLAVVTSGVLRNRPTREMVEAAVSMAVASVPETLPLLATAAQLAAAHRLSERGALVRNVPAVEALGRVDLLCADKTGTLTEGVLRLRAVSDGARHAGAAELDDGLREVLATALLASPPPAAGVPHPTDRALIDGAAVAGVVGDGWERVGEIPFEPARGYHATAARRDDRTTLFVKGAPEVVLPRCARTRPGGSNRSRALDEAGREALLAEVVELASRGWRVLAVAERPKRSPKLDEGEVRDLVFRGFVALADPVRATARAALDALRRAGVETVMITGDHPATARAIARELGLDEDPAVLTGPQLERLDDAELDARLERVKVFARITPALKVRLVAAYQRKGRVVAMTGDGANDAAAIRLADVGIALGAGATAAARGAADLLVTDERIETLVDAVLEGRAMWASVRDAVSTLVGGNLGEVGFTLVGGVLQGRVPIGARQLMLVNLMTDALPALMIAVRPPSHTTPEKLLGEGPERSLGRALERDIAWRALATGGAAMAAWAAARPLASDRRAGTVALLTLVGTQLGQTLWVGWRNPPVVAAALASGALLLVVVQTPGLSQAAGSTPLGPLGLAQAAAGTLGGTLAAGLLPPAVRWADRRFDLSGRVRAFRRGEVGRLVAESRVLRRVRSGLEEVREATADPVPPLVRPARVSPG